MGTGQDDEGRGSFFQTYTAKKFYLLDPKPDEVDPVDIAHHLSLQCRYNGACRVFYSIAEHCVRVSMAIEARILDYESEGAPVDEIHKAARELALWGLLHDASEAYVGDMVRPLKVHDRFFTDAEVQVAAAICERFGLPATEPAIVKHYDMVLLKTEKRDLCAGDLLWSIPDDIQALPDAIAPWSSEYSENAWLGRFRFLGGK